jgi:hypothetical protein
MADIIEEILVKGKRPETFSGGLYGLGGAPGGGGTSGTGIGGLYGLAGPGSYANLARLEADEEFRMLGVNDATAKDETVARENIAAQNYINALGEYRRSPNAINKQTLDKAKQVLADLNVPRSAIESVTNDDFPEGIDVSRGISGVMGPSISGAVDQGIEKGSELFGLGAERLAGLIGADEALSSALLNVPNLGATFVFSDTGPKSPLITGQTPSGTQVGITDPYGIAELIGGIKTGDLGIYDVIGGGAGAVKAATTAYAGDDDPNKKTGVETGVAITPEGSTPDEPKIPAGGEGGGPNKDKGAGAGVVSTRTVGPGLDAGPGPGSDADPARVTLTPGVVSDAELDEIITLIGGRPAVPGGYDTPVLTSSVSPEVPATEISADEAPSGGGGGGGGGGGLPEQSASPTGGMRGVATEQAGVADISMLYDPSLSFAENMARILGKKKNEQADAVDSALMYGGGIVQPTDLNDELLRIIEGR